LHPPASLESPVGAASLPDDDELPAPPLLPLLVLPPPLLLPPIQLRRDRLRRGP